ncbi:hypothetical protein FOZ60_008488 [Perkinsus olseni]|uniref:60S ribosomal protein L9 n=3 Tax=Perkinsus olseni TaxID=32597 RepID=A0A7J6PDS1_PEROL|nr:hypothetical protein FOZ60_008488 [Perkinsus olseni]
MAVILVGSDLSGGAPTIAATFLIIVATHDSPVLVPSWMDTASGSLLTGGRMASSTNRAHHSSIRDMVFPPQGDISFDQHAGLYDVSRSSEDEESLRQLPPPSSRIGINTTTAIPIQNDNFIGELVVIHRPADEGRRRCELRWQGRFLEPPGENVYFGIEGYSPTPKLGFMANITARILMSISTRLAAARGSRLISSMGARGRYTAGCSTLYTDELIHLLMKHYSILFEEPWTCMNVIEHSSGGGSGDCDAVDIPDITSDRGIYGKVSSNHKFDTGHIYTFCYWSMFVDFVTWDLRNLPAISAIDATESFPINSDAFEGKIVVIHRPPDPNGPFPYHGYMGKKRRRWELRWQGRFKRKPSSALFFGIEATQPLPELGFVAKSGVRLVLSISTRLAAARGTMLLTNYPNPDPSENTFFTFPLVSADTCIVSDLDTPSEELPDITADKALTGKVTHDYLFDTEHIYTFCYYSMYIDFVTWDLRNLPVVSGTSLCTFTGHQPIHVIIKDQQDEYFMDVLIAHRCLSPVWADYIAPDESTAEVLNLKKRMSRLSSTDSMDFVSCHSYSWEEGSDASSSSNDVVSVVEVVDVIDKKGDNGQTDKVLVTRKVKMRKRDVVLSPFRLAKKAWSRAFMPCYSGRPSAMRRSRSLSMLGSVSEPRHVKHHHHHHHDGDDDDQNKEDGARSRVGTEASGLMKTIHSQIDIKVPEDVKVTLKSRHIVVSGKYGKLERTFRHIPVDMKLVDGGRKITVEMWFGLTKSKACIRTVCSHIENMITGVRQIRNFLGEKVVRTVDMMPGVSVRKSDDVKDEVIVEGADLELVSRSAALIHQSTLVRHKDIRKFLDGIYVTQSGVIDQLEE